MFILGFTVTFYVPKEAATVAGGSGTGRDASFEIPKPAKQM